MYTSGILCLCRTASKIRATDTQQKRQPTTTTTSERPHKHKPKNYTLVTVRGVHFASREANELKPTLTCPHILCDKFVAFPFNAPRFLYTHFVCVCVNLGAFVRCLDPCLSASSWWLVAAMMVWSWFVCLYCVSSLLPIDLPDFICLCLC